jgi:signal transduction histidine kinase
MTPRRVAWGIWGATVALMVIWPLVAAAAGELGNELIFYLIVPIAVLSYATVGALITSRHPENRIGLILAGVGLTFAVAVLAGDYTTWAGRSNEPLPFAGWVAWLGRVSFALWLAPLPLLFMLYPNGRVLTRRWRPVLWVLVAALGVNLTLFALTPGAIETGFSEAARGEPSSIVNPIGLPLAWKVPIQQATELTGLIAFVCAGLAAISLVLRFRRSRGEERQQIRWLGYVGAVLIAVPVLALLIALVRTLLGVEVNDDSDVVGIVAFIAFFVVLLFGVPAACAIAILRYRLYALDVVVKRTVVFGVLVVLLTAVGGMAAALVGAGIVPSLSDDPTMLVVVGIAYGLLAYPLYRLAKRIADRLVFGGRSTLYEVLSSFTERVGTTYASEDVLPRMAQLLGEATRATTARVWLRFGAELHPAATWPTDAPPVDPVRLLDEALPRSRQEEAFEVRDRGEVLGALSVELPSSDPMNPSKERLILELAAQAGLVLRNVRLIEELRESRRRIVSAQDARAKKLERDIHDGAQQQLVALAVKLGLAERLVRTDPERAVTMLAEARSETSDTLDDLRDLARGIFPPLLADKGLAAALGSQVRKSSVPVEVEPDGIGRYPQETEAAVYFSCLEALQNVAKYAKATRAVVRLMQSEADLRFEVTDDGVGFDPETVSRGTGLQGIADRLAALGGEVTVRSAPGVGTTVAGRIPVGEGAP